MVHNFLERKDRIILTTIDVINEYGIHSVSTRMVAQREGITEAAIFKHFPRKNDLLVGVLDFFSKYDSDIYQSVEINNLKPLEAILFYFETYSSYYQSYPQVTAIINSFDELRYNSELVEKVDFFADNRLNFFKEKISLAQATGEISARYDSDVLADIFIGVMHQICFNWRRHDFEFAFKARIMQSVNTLVDLLKQHNIEEELI